MAKISNLPIALGLSGDEKLPVVQGQATRGVSLAALVAFMQPLLPGWIKGDKGETGPADNTYSNFAGLIASDPTRKRANLAADPEDPNHPNGPFYYVDGAWAPQKADGITFTQVGQESVTRTVDAKLRELGITPQDKGLSATTTAVQNAAAIGSAISSMAASATLSAGAWSIVNPRAAVHIPAGSYSIDGNNPLGQGFTTPQSGYSLRGEGYLVTILRFEPAAPGKTLFTNANVGYGTVRDLSFFSDNAGNGFADFSSDLTAGNGGWHFEDCHWGGSWSYGIRLTGQANNDQYKFSNILLYGAWGQAFFYIPPEGSSPQHINHWFTNVRAYLPSGGLVKVSKGGSLHFSGVELSGVAAAQPTTVFQLLEDGGNTDFLYNGQFNFTGTNIRAELHNADARMMDCRWPTGNVSWRNLDESSAKQAASQPNPEATIISEYTLNQGGATILYESSFLTGVRKFTVPAYPERYSYDLTVRDTTYVLDSDPYLYDPLRVVPQAGETHTAALPIVKARGYRGAPVNRFDNILPFQNNKTYAVGDRLLSSDGYSYRVTSPGTSAATGGFYPSRQNAAANGSVGVVPIDVYSPASYVQNANIKANGVSTVRGCEVLTATLCDDQGGFPARVSADQQNELARIILPPNHRVLRLIIAWEAGSSPQATVANWRIRTAEFSPTELAAVNIGNPSAAYSNSFELNYDTGPIAGRSTSDYGKRIIVLEATTTVTDRVDGAQVRIEYV